MIIQALAGRADAEGRRGRGFVLIDPASREAAIIDPSADRRGLRAFLEAHRAVLRVVASTEARSATPRTTRELAEAFRATWLGAPASPPGAPAPAAPAAAGTVPVARLGAHELTLHAAPDGGAALIAGPLCLFTGLALLAGEIPAQEEAADFRARAAWLRRVLGELPARTRIYPGQGPVSEVGLERTCNQELWG